MLDNMLDTAIPIVLKTSPLPSTGLRGTLYTFGKRSLDIALVLIAVPLLLPLIAILALMVSLDGSPAFYLQPRIGQNGRVFRLWKLRSMVPDAEQALERHLAANPTERAEWDAKQKLLRDPRLTTIGPILRRYSFDELPQLWNVLTGDMSLVGPRPMMPNQRMLYKGIEYFNFRPGLTGLWQVSERNNSNFADRAFYDDLYARTVSAGTDLKVLLQTVRVVFRGTGY